MVDISKYMHFNPHSATPKYQQLANNIIRAVNEEILKQGDTLPSINEISNHFEISRDTVEKGYKHLKEIGILESVPGKGFFINTINVEHSYSILMLFNKLSPQKKIIYDNFISTLGNAGTVDLFIYNNDYNLLKKFLSKRKQDYSYYIIIPHFTDNHEKAYSLIRSLPKERIILLNHLIPEMDGITAAVYENYENDIFKALMEINRYLKKYKELYLIFPGAYYPNEITQGFLKYCSKTNFKHTILKNVNNCPIKAGQAYIVLEDNDLVHLSEKILCTKLILGKEIGIISYNENPLKKVILNGITTISTDFQQMGREIAEMILTKKMYKKAIPFSITLRASL